ncbi:hypothetical protein PsAD46_03317 [Pseudovibrio sp. Ad46]|uniref:hypothetical protein n=1 Tax=Pseudovibrio sp. Ad46 TaxID=989432 RepID=UPI0007AE7010|nr:hypothetical protein [Pseudovibrio sp. Ad46]KZK85726.1 hypothetical protein PsAD46_03317 [Pseudovibrio sp. Ad46]
MKHTEEKLQALWDKACLANQELAAFCTLHKIDGDAFGKPEGMAHAVAATNYDRAMFDELADLYNTAAWSARKYCHAVGENKKQDRAWAKKQLNKNPADLVEAA